MEYIYFIIKSHSIVHTALGEMDLRTTVKNGVLYLEDPVDKNWNPHFFVLTQNKLFYTDSFHGDEEADEDGENEEEENHSGFQRPKEVKRLFF